MLKSISLFTGAGGLDLGLEAAGFKPVACVESDEIARTTIRENRRKWSLVEPGDVHELNTACQKNGLLPYLDLEHDSIDLVAGGPPCQPFSKSSYWANGGRTGRLKDERAKTIDAFFWVVEESLPKAILLENVEGLLYKGKDEGVRHIAELLKKINKRCGTNYRPQLFLLDAKDYGVPQTRKRCFILAHRNGAGFNPPQPTHGPASIANKPYVSTWDAIGDLERLEVQDDLTVTGRYADLLPSIPEGENYSWHTPGRPGKPLFGWRTRYWSFLLKLDRSKPSWTLQANPGSATGPFHWNNRKLSRRELCRLQSFPDSFAPSGSYRQVVKQLGNAVPPLLAEVLGREVRSQWFGHQIRNRSKFELSIHSEEMGEVKTSRVPRKYHDLMGNHHPHPGAGRGPAAM